MTCAPLKSTTGYPGARLDRLIDNSLTQEMVIHSLTASHNRLLLASKLLRNLLPVLADSLERIACELEDDTRLLQNLPTLPPLSD